MQVNDISICRKKMHKILTHIYHSNISPQIAPEDTSMSEETHQTQHRASSSPIKHVQSSQKSLL